MRLSPIFAAAALALSATAAQADMLGPVSDVTVAIGPKLQAKADDYGARELDFLARDLEHSVEARLGKAGLMSPSGGVLALTIADAKPNRPTLEQLGAKPGLSMESIAIGGAEISGQYVAAGAAPAPVGYAWYETDIRNVVAASTWHDASRAFDRFADRLARGETVK